MRFLFLLGTAVTVLQVLDVSITGVSAVETPKPADPLKTPSGTAGNSRTTTRTITKKNQTKPADNAGTPDPVNNDPGTNPNDEDSAEAEPPKTFKESGKRVVKTLKKMATNRGVGLLNGINGLLKKTGGAFNFFGNFLRNRSNNVKDVAKESLAMVSSFSDSTTRGATHLLNSGKVIGKQAGKEMFSNLQKATKLGTTIAKFGGSAVGTPLSISENVVDTANLLVKAPSKLSRMVTNGAIKPIFSYLGPDSDEVKPEGEGEEEEEEEEEEKKEPPPVKAPPTPPRKQIPKK